MGHGLAQCVAHGIDHRGEGSGGGVDPKCGLVDHRDDRIGQPLVAQVNVCADH